MDEKPKPTPAKVAAAWAKDHPDFTGLLSVVSEAHRGRDGRLGWMERLNAFFVDHGRAAATRKICKKDGLYLDHPPSNGYCEICGRLYLEPCLVLAAMPEPLAGQEVPEAELPRMDRGTGMVYRYDDHSVAMACPACIEAHGGRPDRTYAGISYAGIGEFLFRRRSPLAKTVRPALRVFDPR
jgi:hypothetical protein